MSAGSKIIDGLKAALAGDFTRITIEGQVWVRQDVVPDESLISKLGKVKQFFVSDHGYAQADAVERAIEELTENEAASDLRWQADMRGIRAWQADHPGSDLIWPDHGDLVTWLIDKLEEWKQAAGVEAGLRREFLARAEAAEATLELIRKRERDECDKKGRKAHDKVLPTTATQAG